MDILDLVGDFTWDFGLSYFIETGQGNFVYHSEHNTISRTNDSYQEWIGDSFGRCKGKHVIRNYCGNNVIVTKSRSEAT